MKKYKIIAQNKFKLLDIVYDYLFPDVEKSHQLLPHDIIIECRIKDGKKIVQIYRYTGLFRKQVRKKEGKNESYD